MSDPHWCAINRRTSPYNFTAIAQRRAPPHRIYSTYMYEYVGKDMNSVPEFIDTVFAKTSPKTLVFDTGLPMPKAGELPIILSNIAESISI